MISKASTFLGCLLLGGTCFISPSLAQDISSNIAMWKIQSTQNTVYLLGSVHVGKSCTLESPRIDAALADAENTVFEIDYDTITPDKQLQFSLEISNIGRLKPGDQTLKDSVDTQTYEAIRQKFDALKPTQFKISLDDINAIYHPSFIAFQIQGFKALTQGLSGECGIDKILTSKARSANKKIIALETFEQQKQLIQSILESTRTLDTKEQFQPVLNEDTTDIVNGLISSVLDGKLEEIETQITESCKSTPKLCYKVLDERNLTWLEQIKTYLQDQEDYFIIVGAAHMVGPNSLITLLESANYNVESF